MKGDDAQNKINEMIALNLEEFYAGIHLHQEAIRDIILGDPLERSRTIDKLLGLYRLRELIEALPVSYVKREAKKLCDEAETLKKN